MPITYRHPDKDDLEVITSIVNSSRRGDKFHREITSEEHRTETFGDPDFRKDGAWLAFDEGKPVAYGAGIVEEERQKAGLDDGWIAIDILPEMAGSGVEDGLLARILGYIESRGVGRAHAFAHRPAEWKNRLLRSHGFNCVRRFYQLAWRGTSPLPPLKLPDGLELRSKMFRDMTDDEIVLYAEVHNDTFSEHFLFSPTPVSRYLSWRDACEDPLKVDYVVQSSRIIGMCVIEDSVNYNRERGVRTGWINVLGVRKAFRKQGIGTYLLTEGINWLVSLGYDTVYIGVDGENENALGLYRSLGFEVEHESLVYRYEFGR